MAWEVATHGKTTVILEKRFSSADEDEDEDEEPTAAQAVWMQEKADAMAEYFATGDERFPYTTEYEDCSLGDCNCDCEEVPTIDMAAEQVRIAERERQYQETGRRYGRSADDWAYKRPYTGPQKFPAEPRGYDPEDEVVNWKSPN
jgi:hypothetical protein